VPFEKLTYGVFLINSVLMQFRTFNLSNGVWVESFDLQLLFLSFLTLSFMLSMVTYLFVEAPMSNLLNNFIAAKRHKVSNQFYMSQSAKAHLRDKRSKKKQPEMADSTSKESLINDLEEDNLPSIN
jgi:peptidoglycan/LPS O-acetylase OafA/YrhL